MENIDRMKRQEAGRKVLAEAGYTDEKEILAVLGSPTKVLDPQAKEWTPVPPPPVWTPPRLMDARQRMEMVDLARQLPLPE
jgi:hypothetical protein